MIKKFNLSERQKQVLYFIIDAYSRDGAPIGSRHISKYYKHETLSPATIRNVMADLEEMNLLSQPHVSAGRVPTDIAFRLFVENLILSRSFSTNQIQSFKNRLLLMEDNPSSENIFQQLSHLLSDYTGHIGIVLSPTINQIKCKNIRFVKINESKILVVFISKSGIVHNKIINVERNYTQDELDRISNLVREKFRNKTTYEIAENVKKLMKEEKVEYDSLLQSALELSEKGIVNFDEEDNEVYTSGTEQYLENLSKEDYDRLIHLYKTFEDKAKLLKLLQQCLKEDGLNVIIGSENLLRDLKDFSIISATYSSQGRKLGTLAVLGPKIMNYNSTIGLVHYSTKYLSDLLTKNGF